MPTIRDVVASRVLGGLGRRFGGLWGSYALANLADGLVLVGFPLIAVQLTRSPLLVAGTTVALTLPWFLFGLPAGALVDRLDRRTLMVCASVPRVAALALVGLAAWGGMLSMPLLYAAAFVVGTAEALFDTSGQALIPMVVDRDRFRRANGRLFGTRVVMNNFVGAPLAGVLVAFAVTAALWAPAGLYLLAPLALLVVRGRRYVPQRGSRSTIRADIKDGLVHLWRDRVVRSLAAFAGAANLTSDAFFSVFVLYAVGTASALHLSEFAFGVLLATSAIGAAVGAVTVERLERRIPTRPLMTANNLGMVAGLAIPAVVPNTFVVGGALALAGFSAAVLSVLSASLRQELIPENLLGRVSSGFRLIAFGTRPVGAILAGAIASAIGVRPLFLLCAGTLLLATPLVARLRLPRRDHASADRSAMK